MGGIALKPDIVTSRREETNGQIWLDLSHNGYEEGFGLIHRRRLYLSANGEDFDGRGAAGRQGRQFLCLALPSASRRPGLDHLQNGQAALMKLAKGLFWRMRVQGGELALGRKRRHRRRRQVRRTQQLVVLGGDRKRPDRG